MMETKIEKKPEAADGPAAGSSDGGNEKPKAPAELKMPEPPGGVENARIEQRDKSRAESNDRPSPRAGLGDPEK